MKEVIDTCVDGRIKSGWATVGKGVPRDRQRVPRYMHQFSMSWHSQVDPVHTLSAQPGGVWWWGQDMLGVQ